MDDGTIAWMIRGGSRTETREARLQRQHRAILSTAMADQPSPADSPGWHHRLTSWIGITATPVATTTDCCAA